MCDKNIFNGYGYDVITLKKINEIKRNTNNAYHFKNVRFLLKTLEKNDILVISFHGAVKNKDKKLSLEDTIFLNHYVIYCVYQTL